MYENTWSLYSSGMVYEEYRNVSGKQWIKWPFDLLSVGDISQRFCHNYIYLTPLTANSHQTKLKAILQVTKWSWRRNQMETFSTLLALCAGNSLVTSEFPSQRPVTGSCCVFFICTWTDGSVNNLDAGDLRCHCAHYDVTVMWMKTMYQNIQCAFINSLRSGDNICSHSAGPI